MIRALSPRLVGVAVDMLQNVGDSSLKSRLLVLVGIEVVEVAAATSVSVPVASQGSIGHHGNVELDTILASFHHEVIETLQDGVIPLSGTTILQTREVYDGSVLGV